MELMGTCHCLHSMLTERMSTLPKTETDVTTKDDDGRMALYLAAERGHTDVAKAFLEKGANVNAEGG